MPRYDDKCAFNGCGRRPCDGHRLYGGDAEWLRVPDLAQHIRKEHGTYSFCKTHQRKLQRRIENIKFVGPHADVKMAAAVEVRRTLRPLRSSRLEHYLRLACRWMVGWQNGDDDEEAAPPSDFEFASDHDAEMPDVPAVRPDPPHPILTLPRLSSIILIPCNVSGLCRTAGRVVLSRGMPLRAMESKHATPLLDHWAAPPRCRELLARHRDFPRSPLPVLSTFDVFCVYRRPVAHGEPQHRPTILPLSTTPVAT
jgi:hypothetical protein